MGRAAPRGAAGVVVRVRDGWVMDMVVGHPRARCGKRYRGRPTVSETPRPFGLRPRRPSVPTVGSPTMTTVFSRIIAGELPARFVWSDEHAVAFLSVNPVAPGHTLVVSRLEIDQWTDAPAPLMAHLMTVAHAVGAAISAVWAPPRVGLLVAGFEVPHLHLHAPPSLRLGRHGGVHPIVPPLVSFASDEHRLHPIIAGDLPARFVWSDDARSRSSPSTRSARAHPGGPAARGRPVGSTRRARCSPTSPRWRSASARHARHLARPARLLVAGFEVPHLHVPHAGGGHGSLRLRERRAEDRPGGAGRVRRGTAGGAAGERARGVGTDLTLSSWRPREHGVKDVAIGCGPRVARRMPLLVVIAVRRLPSTVRGDGRLPR